MLSAEERRRLVRQHEDDPPGPLVALLKCAAGILTLVAVAAGPWLLLNSEAAKSAAEQPAFQVARSFPSVAESKRIFDERRERYQPAGRGGAPREVSLATGSSRGSE